MSAYYGGTCRLYGGLPDKKANPFRVGIVIENFTFRCQLDPQVPANDTHDPPT